MFSCSPSASGQRQAGRGLVRARGRAPRRRRYLTGDRFTAADLTFAAPATPVVQPELWRRLLPDGVATPASAQPLIEAFRAHPAGRFALGLCDQER
jgi:glutathione S-transferase